MPWAQRLGYTVFRLNSKSLGSVTNSNSAVLVPAPQRALSAVGHSSRRTHRCAREQACSSSSAPAAVEGGASSAVSGNAALDLAIASSSAMTDSTSITPLLDIRDATDAAYRVVNFYHLVKIANPHQVIAEHKLWAKERDLCGRIYLSTQGINAQYSGLTADAEGYARWLEEQDLFKGLRWSSFPVDSHQFPKLRLKFKQNLISLAGGMTRLPVTDPQARATPLAPHQWKEMLANAQLLTPAHESQHIDHNQAAAAELRPDSAAESSSSGEEQEQNGSFRGASSDVVVLDVRNDYEWDAGHFQGAERPQEENFNETPTESSSSDAIPSYLQGKDPNTPVMMYCTGGIRCDVYSAHLRDKGFNNLYTLEGGIQNYLREEGHELWDGSLFVFDGRMAVPSGDPAHEGQLVAAAPCAACGGAASLPHMNCANIDCNKLFLACDTHKEAFAGCCSQQCMEAPRLLRPPKQAGYYGNWTSYSSDDEMSKASMIGGRGSGRLARRRKRIDRLRSKESAARVERQARKDLVKAALQSRQDSQHQQPEPNETHQQNAIDLTAQRLERIHILQQQQRSRAQLTI